MKSFSINQRMETGIASSHFKYFLKHNPELGKNQFQVPKSIKKITKYEKEKSFSCQDKFQSDNDNSFEMIHLLENYLQLLENSS